MVDARFIKIGTLCAPAISPAAYVKARHSRGQGILLLLIAFTVLVIIFVCGAICIFQLCPLCSGICNLQGCLRRRVSDHTPLRIVDGVLVEQPNRSHSVGICGKASDFVGQGNSAKTVQSPVCGSSRTNAQIREGDDTDHTVVEMNSELPVSMTAAESHGARPSVAKASEN